MKDSKDKQLVNILTSDGSDDNAGTDILDALIDFGYNLNININNLVEFRETFYSLDSVNYYYLILNKE